MHSNARRLVMISVLAALSFVSMYVLQIPLIPSAPFLQWDPSDIPNVLGGFALGPVAATVISLLKSLLHLIFKGEGGPIGAFMAFASGAAYAGGAALVYRRWRDTRGLLGGFLLGTLLLTAVMFFINYYWALGAWGIPAEARLPLIKTAVIPFNLLRGVISSIVIYPVYAAMRGTLARWTEQHN
ncbi:MAG: ECF transporter S component [Bacillota bacterium]|jgi:riboflavin transporter FmnP